MKSPPPRQLSCRKFASVGRVLCVLFALNRLPCTRSDSGAFSELGLQSLPTRIERIASKI